MKNKWHGCYDDSWKDHIVPEAFSHPAKMAYGLLCRIIQHIKHNKWAKKGSVIVDPFGGIGSTGILGTYNDYYVVCVELEQKFVDLAKQNMELHRNAWTQFGNPEPVILQGDSRKLCELVESADKPGKLDLVISSPPYADDISRDRANENFAKSKADYIRGGKSQYTTYGNTEGNLGNLKAGEVDCVISSPPYEGQVIRKRDLGKSNQGATQGKHCCDEYGKTEGQLGQENPDTFWASAKTIVQQCHQILRPGGHAIFVTKDFVRKGQRVTFSDDWQKLCESIGFKTVCRHQAMLVKEEVKDSLFGDRIVSRKERKSFFRRLAESKGSPRIDHEDVICMEK